MQPKKTTAANVKRLRKKKGWSARRLADEADLSSVRMIEAGLRPGSMETLEKIATALGVTVSDLVREPRRRRA